jgi:hypothetical protein
VVPLYSEGDISSEQMEETRQLCERIFALEAEETRLKMTIAHLDDQQVFELTYEQLASYGFELWFRVNAVAAAAWPFGLEAVVDAITASFDAHGWAIRWSGPAPVGRLSEHGWATLTDVRSHHVTKQADK